MDRLATHDDANLILRLYELRREDKMRQARAWFVANFYPASTAEYFEICPPGSEQNAWARMVLTYWEMVASFVDSGVLNDELFFQSGQELLLTWIRLRPLVQDWRTTMGNPKTYKNIEAVGERYIQYWQQHMPGAFEGFQARVGTRPAQAPKAS